MLFVTQCQFIPAANKCTGCQTKGQNVCWPLRGINHINIRKIQDREIPDRCFVLSAIDMASTIIMNSSKKDVIKRSDKKGTPDLCKQFSL